MYDGEELIGARYRDNNYYYIKNAMSDVIGVVNESGEQIVSYAYNAWGKVIVNERADNLSGDDYQFARYNPMLYRSYYYDEMTSQYYLQSRYYMPNICRFMNADIPDIAQQSKDDVNGLNLFAYCNNNPVNYVDYTGHATNNYSNKSIIEPFLKKYFDGYTYYFYYNKIKESEFLYYVNVSFLVKINGKSQKKSITIYWENKKWWKAFVNSYNNSSVKVIRNYIANNRLPQEPRQALPELLIRSCALYFVDNYISFAEYSKESYYKVWGESGIDKRERNDYVMFVIRGYYHSSYVLTHANKLYRKVR